MSLKRILLVEDDAQHEALALCAFKKCQPDAQVTVARDGEQALEYLLGNEGSTGRAAPVLPCVVLLDLRLPRVSGLEVLRRLRCEGRTRMLPVVVLTVSGEQEDIARTYTLGANGYITKSADPGRFADSIRSVSQQWLGEGASQPEHVLP